MLRCPGYINNFQAIRIPGKIGSDGTISRLGGTSVPEVVMPFMIGEIALSFLA